MNDELSLLFDLYHVEHLYFSHGIGMTSYNKTTHDNFRQTKNEERLASLYVGQNIHFISILIREDFTNLIFSRQTLIKYAPSMAPVTE